MAAKQTDMHSTYKIGQYFSCDFEAINQGLERQQQLASQGIKKLLGEILIDLQAITHDDLKEAINLQRFNRVKISQLFKDLGDDDLKYVCQSMEEQEIPVGETFIHQDSSGNCFYLLVKGEAQVYRVGDRKSVV